MEVEKAVGEIDEDDTGVWEKNKFSPLNIGSNIIEQYIMMLLYCLHITSF